MSLSVDFVTIFSTLPVHFPTPDNKKIKTKEFLKASEGVVILVGKMGKVLSPVVNDMNGNITKITQKYREDEDSHEFVEDMVLKHKENGDLNVVESLQWLRRGLHCITRFFELVLEELYINSDTQDLYPFMKSAYNESLAEYHGWVVAKLVTVLLRFTPSKQQLFYHFSLESPDNKEALILQEMKIYTEKMSACVDKLTQFYQQHQLETNYKI